MRSVFPIVTLTRNGHEDGESKDLTEDSRTCPDMGTIAAWNERNCGSPGLHAIEQKMKHQFGK